MASNNRTNDTILVKNSPYFQNWSKTNRLFAKEIYDLYTLLKKYSYIVSDGSIDVKFLIDSQAKTLGDKSSLLLKDKTTVYLNSSRLFQGKIDAVIGELIFSLIAKDSMKKVSLDNLLQTKLQKSTSEIFDSNGTKIAEYNLDDFLSKTLVVTGNNIITTTFGNKQFTSKNGSIKVIGSFTEIEQLMDNDDNESLLKAILGLNKTEEKGAIIDGTINKIEYILSCLSFFKRYTSLSPHIVKYCESYIKEGMKEDSYTNFCELFKDLALVYIFGDTPESIIVDKFVTETGLNDLTNMSMENISKIVVQYFEKDLDNHIQSMLNDIPADILLEVNNVNELRDNLGSLALVRDKKNILSHSKTLKTLLFNNV